MKRNVLKINVLKKLGYNTFTAACAKKHKISHQHIEYYLKRGIIQRISHGVYIFTDAQSPDFEFIIKEKLMAFPRAIVGLKTALRLYDLIEELPSDIDLLVSSENVPKRKMEDVVLHRVKEKILRRGVVNLRGIPVTSIERTIIDLLREKESVAFILQIINEAKKKSIIIETSKLKKMAVDFRVKKSLQFLLEAWIG